MTDEVKKSLLEHSKTPRGFRCIEFRDPIDNSVGYLQESSSADRDELWLGVGGASIRVTQGLARELVYYLRGFIKTGDLSDPIYDLQAPAKPSDAPNVYEVGPTTLAKVLKPAGLTDIHDLQAVLDAVERVLKKRPPAELTALVKHALPWREGGSYFADAKDTNKFIDLAVPFIEALEAAEAKEPSEALGKLMQEPSALERKPFNNKEFVRGQIEAYLDTFGRGWRDLHPDDYLSAFAHLLQENDLIPQPSIPNMVTILKEEDNDLQRILTVPWEIGTRVTVDGDKELRCTIIAYCWRGITFTAELSWFAAGVHYTDWFEIGRLSPVKD